MTKDIISERSEILSLFNEAELTRLLEEQITSDSAELNGIPIDYFKPLYYKYTNMMRDAEMNEDLRDELKSRFQEISLIFIEQIEKVFNIKVSSRWKEDHESDIPCLAVALYSFFVIELHSNIEDSIHEFIMKNADLLAQLFEDRKSKRDASTLIYSKTLSPEKALLIANIYDVSLYVIENITEEEFLENLPDGYVPGEILYKLYKDGNITGEFMEVISKMFNDSSYLKSMICFEIESSYRKQSDKKESAE